MARVTAKERRQRAEALSRMVEQARVQWLGKRVRVHLPGMEGEWWVPERGIVEEIDEKGSVSVKHLTLYDDELEGWLLLDAWGLAACLSVIDE